MSEPLPEGAPEPTPSKGYAWIAWLVIILTVVGIVSGRSLMEQFSENSPTTAPSHAAAVVLELQARYIIGIHHFAKPLAQGLTAEIEKMNSGEIDKRLRIIVLLGETAGPADALKRLDELDALSKKHGIELAERQKRVRDVLRAAYLDFEKGNWNAPSVHEADRAFLLDELGWFGTLALNPEPQAGMPQAGRDEAIRPAQITVVTMLSAFVLAGLFIVIGFIAVVVFIVLNWNGSIQWRFRVGASNANIYAETFALWLVFYSGGTLALSMLAIDIPLITRAIVFMLLSLSTLAWPIVRGISWRRLREDIGLICPGNPLTEIAAGVWCYIVNLPFVAFGFAITASLLLLRAQVQMPVEGNVENFSNEPMPSHPILPILADGDWPMRVQIFFLACIVAPLVEEIMFRGVLHRHCRELTSGWRPFASVFVSTTVVSFLFAAVHPQGLTTIPVLMNMAFGFSLAREWRASLLPSMFAHGISNGIVLTLASIALSK